MIEGVRVTALVGGGSVLVVAVDVGWMTGVVLLEVTIVVVVVWLQDDTLLVLLLGRWVPVSGPSLGVLGSALGDLDLSDECLEGGLDVLVQSC